jgi:GTP1/Obg family GTP-binding protein
MAETALERYKKDQEQQEEKKTLPGEKRELSEVQDSFLKALENITEPTPPVKYLKPFNPFQKEDKSLARFIVQGSPNLKMFLDYTMSKKYG